MDTTTTDNLSERLDTLMEDLDHLEEEITLATLGGTYDPDAYQKQWHDLHEQYLDTYRRLYGSNE